MRRAAEGRLRPRGVGAGRAQARGGRLACLVMHAHVTFVSFLLFVPSAIGVLPRAHGTILRSSICIVMPARPVHRTTDVLWFEPGRDVSTDLKGGVTTSSVHARPCNSRAHRRWVLKRLGTACAAATPCSSLRLMRKRDRVACEPTKARGYRKLNPCLIFFLFFSHLEGLKKWPWQIAL